MQRLKQSEVAKTRQEILKQQNNHCALCHQTIQEGEAVLDHCHKTGQIRGVLHRGCNAFEGTIVNALPRNLITAQRLLNIMTNLASYQRQLKPLLHPTYRTPEERQLRAKKRAKAQRIKRNQKGCE
jgi:hypothetical protein